MHNTNTFYFLSTYYKFFFFLVTHYKYLIVYHPKKKKKVQIPFFGGEKVQISYCKDTFFLTTINSIIIDDTTTHPWYDSHSTNTNFCKV